MEPIGVGDWVECIGANPKAISPTYKSDAKIVLGGVYLVREIMKGRYPDGKREDGLRFVGIIGVDPTGREGGWPVSMFRPIYRPKTDAFTHLLTDIPSDLKVV